MWERAAWDVPVDEWWHVLEVNVLGVHLCCRTVIPSMLERGGGHIVITGSGASYLPGSTSSAYAASKAAVGRYGEALAGQLEGRIPVFVISPGLVRTHMTEEAFPDNAPWTPPELAPRLVRELASGRFDVLAGRYLHAEHDPVARLEAAGRPDPGRGSERDPFTTRKRLSNRLLLVRLQPVCDELPVRVLEQDRRRRALASAHRDEHLAVADPVLGRHEAVVDEPRTPTPRRRGPGTGRRRPRP